jgi:hypothetical protein
VPRWCTLFTGGTALSIELLTPGIIGAVFGSLVWLVVGLFIQGMQFKRQARNAARAVYIELEMNRLGIVLAHDYASYQPLSRSAFERLLPELATWLGAADLRLVAAAYMAHAGYEQARPVADLPTPMRQQALSGVLAAQDAALKRLGELVFTRAERKAAPAALKLDQPRM